MVDLEWKQRGASADYDVANPRLSGQGCQAHDGLVLDRGVSLNEQGEGVPALLGFRREARLQLLIPNHLVLEINQLVLIHGHDEHRPPRGRFILERHRRELDAQSRSRRDRGLQHQEEHQNEENTRDRRDVQASGKG